MPKKGAKNAPLKGPDASAQLAADLREWWNNETSDWDALVEGSGDSAQDGADANTASDLWGTMPTVDSKAVARTAPIFEEHLGIPLDISLIRPGGYGSIGDVIADLVPKMVERQSSLQDQVA